MLGSLPGVKYAVNEENKEAHADEAQEHPLRSLVVVPLVPFLVVNEH